MEVFQVKGVSEFQFVMGAVRKEEMYTSYGKEHVYLNNFKLVEAFENSWTRGSKYHQLCFSE